VHEVSHQQREVILKLKGFLVNIYFTPLSVAQTKKCQKPQPQSQAMGSNPPHASRSRAFRFLESIALNVSGKRK